MPWHAAKSSRCPAAKPWAVIKDADGSVVACHPSKADAQRQVAALYVNEGASMSDKATAGRAEWTAAYVNDLPDSSFLYIAPGGSKDADGKTAPRSLRYFPVKDAQGNVDLPHLRNALARIPQANLSAGVKAAAIKKAQVMLQAATRSEHDEGAGMPDDQHETMSGGEVVSRDLNPAAMRFREEGDSPPILEGRMMPYDEWTEVRSPIEGHFMERFAPGSLAKTMAEQADRIRVMFEHGFDSVFGKQAIAAVDEMRDEADGAYYRASLLQGVPELLISGLRRGLYGSSIRYAPVKWERVRSPKASDHNPESIPEHTVREAAMKEFSVVPFPQYSGATAMVRSSTYELVARQLLADPASLLEYITNNTDRTSTTALTEPQHSDPEEPVEPVAPERSRSTQQPSRDYLKPGKGDAPWRL
jgi:HK97 family phage prohead protease